MVINQREVYWADLGENSKRPVLVIQNNLFNESRIATVVVCAITSNVKRAKAPGNVMLKKGDANLNRPSVVNISQIFTLAKSDLMERIGQLSSGQFNLVLDGIKLILEPME